MNIMNARSRKNGKGDDIPSRRSFLKTAFKVALGLGVCTGINGSLPEIAVTRKNSMKKKKKTESLPIGTGFVFDEAYLRHTLGIDHPESPERLEAILRRMKASGLDKAVKTICPSEDPLPYIKAIHPESHIKLAAQQAYDDSICRLAVSGGLSAVDAVCQGKMRNAFCALRPPGHHAFDHGEYGFCFYNNIAIAARYAQTVYKLKNVLIVDWDFHHGNGTERAFYKDPSVLYFSTHRLEAFPGTGFPARRGKGKGYGFNINVPLAHGADDKAILNAFEIDMASAANRFKPDLVLISAGFDSRKKDLLGDFAVTDEGFAKLTRLMMSIAKTHAQSRLISFLEGGYNTEGLALAVESHIETLLGQAAPSVGKHRGYV